MVCFVDSGSRVRGNDVAWGGMTWVWRGNGVLYGFWVDVPSAEAPACAGMT